MEGHRMNQPVPLPVNLPHTGPSRVGQGTAVEQSRATSEIYYRVLVAQQVPRDEDAVVENMKRSCSKLRLAEKAFYKLPRGRDNTVEGPSVHLARELARIWGNVDYGVTELRQDDEYGQSEIQAYAWDLQTNARSQQTFIVPHKKDVGKTTRALVQNQEIYENNANAGARRVRETIFAVLPTWFVEEAQEICKAAIAQGDGTPLADRITGAIAAFKKDFGITEAQLETKLARSKDRWDEQDVAGLSVTYKSLKAREVTKEQEFPAADQKVTADELIGGEDRSDEQRDLEAEEGNL
jgi:hypothetical protein